MYNYEIKIPMQNTKSSMNLVVIQGGPTSFAEIYAKKIFFEIVNINIGSKSYFATMTRCLKITEKVSFNIASEASYVYILSGQKLIKNAKNGPFWRVFENLKLAAKQCYQTGQF